MMNLAQYALYLKLRKKEQQMKKENKDTSKQDNTKHNTKKNNVAGNTNTHTTTGKTHALTGYSFSDLVDTAIYNKMNRTQGSFLIGVNLNDLYNLLKNN